MTDIDLNADLGEGDASDEQLLQHVSSCNIACGGHAGDPDSMATAIRSALANGVAVGAHPAYPDRPGFGRTSGFMQGGELYDSLLQQVTELADIAAQLGAKLAHIKPHGALYNDAVHDVGLADVIARVVSEMPGDPALVGMADTELMRAAQRNEIAFLAEGFVDRAYEADGTLVSRAQHGAVHSDINTITNQAVSLAKHGEVTARNGALIEVRADTLCIHGDTPGAAEIARAVRDVLENRGVTVRAATRS
ncbi:MAG: 5-oxoprolinase subunit PxpA [Woeseiaceae bacterium]